MHKFFAPFLAVLGFFLFLPGLCYSVPALLKWLAGPETRQINGFEIFPDGQKRTSYTPPRRPIYEQEGMLPGFVLLTFGSLLIGASCGLNLLSRIAMQTAYRPQPSSPDEYSNTELPITYSILKDGFATGPYEAADIKVMLATGGITQGTQIRRKGAAEWKPIEQLPELRGI